MLIPFSKITKKYNMKIHGILHIGAHSCEELGSYNEYGLKNNQIIWVEANPKLVEQNLRVDTSRIIKNFICCDTDQGKTKLNIANNSESSSILELGTHIKSYPSIKYYDFVEVNNHRIDTMYDQDKIPKNFANFLNIDIQGAELLALKGMGDLINYFDYLYLEVNRDYVYKNCALVHEIDEYLSKYKYIRVETCWTNAQWGDALYIRIKNNLDLLKNVRCSEEIWQFNGITLEEALEIAKHDSRVKALHWYNKDGGDGRIGNINGWYQGTGGSIGTVINNEWDTIILNDDNNTTSTNKHKFSLCIPTMDRYDKFLSIYLPKYINNPFIDEIIISDENGNDTKKIKDKIQNLDKFKFNINNKTLGAFYNKIKCCQLAKNDWIALIDSDNFADIDYFVIANNFLNNNDIKPNTILAPTFAKPKFDFSQFSGTCFKKGNFKNIPNCKEMANVLINTGNYILNKYLIDNLILKDEDKILTDKVKCCDVCLLNTLFFEKLDLEMYIVKNLSYEHNVHNGSNYLKFNKNINDIVSIIYQRYFKLLDEN